MNAKPTIPAVARPTPYDLAAPIVPAGGPAPAPPCPHDLDGRGRDVVCGYLRTLGPALHQRYGRRPHYTPAQVRETAIDRGLGIDYVCWAYMLYCTPTDFAVLHAAAGEACDLGAMRDAVAGAFFHGNTGFDASELAGAIVAAGGAAAGAAVSAAGDACGWLADVDWSGLLDWS